MSITSPTNAEAVSRPYTPREPYHSATLFDQIRDVIRVSIFAFPDDYLMSERMADGLST